jgi:hypothetical protein
MARPYQRGAHAVEKLATAGLDGRLVIWDVAGLEGRMSGMTIRH